MQLEALIFDLDETIMPDNPSAEAAAVAAAEIGASRRGIDADALAASLFNSARAVWRADLWNPDTHIDRSQLPTMGQMLADQIKGYDAAATDKILKDNRHNLYGLD